MQLSFTSPDCNYCWRNLQTLLSNLRECTKTEVYRMSTVPFFFPLNALVHCEHTIDSKVKHGFETPFPPPP